GGLDGGMGPAPRPPGGGGSMLSRIAISLVWQRPTTCTGTSKPSSLAARMRWRPPSCISAKPLPSTARGMTCGSKYCVAQAPTFGSFSSDSSVSPAARRCLTSGIWEASSRKSSLVVGRLMPCALSYILCWDQNTSGSRISSGFSRTISRRLAETSSTTGGSSRTGTNSAVPWASFSSLSSLGAWPSGLSTLPYSSTGSPSNCRATFSAVRGPSEPSVPGISFVPPPENLLLIQFQSPPCLPSADSVPDG